MRILTAIDSLRGQCRVVAAITANSRMENCLARAGTKYIVTPKKNPAQTSMLALAQVETPLAFLVDSDCIVLPETVHRLQSRLIERDLDAISARVEFEEDGWSSCLTALQRELQYYAFDRLYEPGLLVNIASLSAKVGYIFTGRCPFTPDGELDYRVRRCETVSWEVDRAVGLRHAPLGFWSNLMSHRRYGRSDVAGGDIHGWPFWVDVAEGTLRKYLMALSFTRPIQRVPAALIADAAYAVGVVEGVVRWSR